MAVSKRLRYEVLKRDQNRCRYCGRSAPEVKLTVDHVVPTTLGGSDKPENLAAACADCNSGKSATPPEASLVADVQSDALRWAKAMQTVLAEREAELEADRKRVAKWERKWRSYKFRDRTFPKAANWKNSLIRWMAGGLSDEFLADAIGTAMGKPGLPVEDVWRYFCGVCSRELDRIQERVAAQLNDHPSEKQTAPDNRLPYGAGLDPSFDALNRAEGYLVDLIDHAGVDRGDVVKLASLGFWAGMESAYKAFMDGPGEHWESAEEHADEEFSNSTAWYLNEIRVICQGQQVPNGS